jgi:Ca-activated chloride channel family protein
MKCKTILQATAIGVATVLVACSEVAMETAETGSAGQRDSATAESAPPPPTQPPAAKLSPQEMLVIEAAPQPQLCCAHTQPATAPAYYSQGRELYAEYEDNTYKLVAEERLSTFSIDVDTASYARVRRYLNDGYLPPAEAVRTEELVNYFTYDYPLPEDREQPFRPDVALFDAPWDSQAQILRIGLKGFDIPPDERAPANLVFLIDTSGSMSDRDKLPLVKKSLRMLANEMRPEDRIGIVAYAGYAGVVLEPTRGSEKGRIMRAIDSLRSGGGTAGGAGIQLAYDLAKRHYRDGAVNRVVLATDGDFNIGVNNPDSLEKMIAKKRKTGIYLSVLGFGKGNLQDRIMQKLAQAGNGNAAYIDSFKEARKVLADEMGGTLFTIADDVKVQVEFNPAYVAEYRLIGYETRLLKREDFNNDRVDAGEVGSGHTVTALYEVFTTAGGRSRVDPLRYGEEPPQPATGKKNGELAWVKVRFKQPGASDSELLTTPVMVAARTSFEAAPRDARFATAVAAFGQLLTDNKAVADFDYNDVLGIARDAKGEDFSGHRAEFTQLVQTAAELARLAAVE